MLDYYYGTVKEIVSDSIIIVKSPDFRVDSIEVMLPAIISHRPKIGDSVEYVYSYDSRSVKFGLFVRYENEQTLYLDECIHKGNNNEMY